MVVGTGGVAFVEVAAAVELDPLAGGPWRQMEDTMKIINIIDIANAGDIVDMVRFLYFSFTKTPSKRLYNPII